MIGYYGNRAVRARMIDYLGGDSLAAATALYLTRCDGQDFTHPDLKQPAELDYFLGQGLDVGRSLWDRKAVIVHLDIEYVNFDFPAEPYLDLPRTFTLQETVVAAIEEILAGYGISPLHLLTGRGHHFVWQIPRDSAAFAQLVGLEDSFPHGTKNAKVYSSELDETVPAEFNKAFAGLGLVIEFIAQEIKARAAPRSPLPVELTAVETGPGERGREMVSIDISEYGDPLHTRMIRIPFSVYLKPWTKHLGLDDARADTIPRMLVIPAGSLNSRQAVAVMQDQAAAVELAERTTTKIPAAAAAMERVVADYRQAPLSGFHRWFYSQEHEPHARWPETYDRTPLAMLPPCVARVLQQPNDLLLIPAYIQLLVRSLLALGWHPRHIAGLIRSKYERDHGWGHYWLTYDAATRADCYTRIFAGTFVSGRDDLIDFNCLSTQEKGLCHAPHAHCALDLFQASLLARRRHDHLACRPFNRLFLP